MPESCRSISVPNRPTGSHHENDNNNRYATLMMTTIAKFVLSDSQVLTMGNAKDQARDKLKVLGTAVWFLKLQEYWRMFCFHCSFEMSA